MPDVVIDGVPSMVLLLSMVHVFVACHLLRIVVDFIIIQYVLIFILS